MLCATFCFNGTVEIRFLIVWLLETKNESYTIIRNAKGSSSAKMNYRQVLQSRVYILKRRGIVHFEVLKPGKTVNALLHYAIYWPIGKNQTEGVILQRDNAKPLCVKRTLNKINEWGWNTSLPTTLTPYWILRYRFSCKEIQYFDDLQKDVSTIDFYRSDIENIYILDCKRFIITKVNILLIRNEVVWIQQSHIKPYYFSVLLLQLLFILYVHLPIERLWAMEST